MRDLGEAVADLQVRRNEMVVEVPHPTLGRFRTLGIPVKLSCTPGRLRPPAPTLGEQTDNILTEAEDGPEETRLRAEGVG